MGVYSFLDVQASIVGPGGANNHQFILPASTNLPMDNFDNYADLGPLALSHSSSQTIVTWASGTNVNNHIRLQTSTNLLNGWSDVPNTTGVGGATNNFGNGSVYFRLTGP